MAVYLATDGRSDVYLGVSDRYVPQGSPEETRSVDLNGRRAYLVERTDSTVVLSWQRRDNQWVTLTGNGRFATEAAVLALAAAVVDQPQQVPLQVRLAPAGWRLAAFKDNRILTLHDPATKQSLSVNLVDQPTSNLMRQVMDARRVSPVRVNGTASELVETTYGWFLQVPLPGGSAFHLQAPTQLTREQVIAIAEQVSITPRR
jgi:glycine/D-amino acid oxidase-like deaminating enzyme